MKLVSKWLSDPSAAAALSCCLVVALVDIGFRLLPERPDRELAGAQSAASLFSRQEPGQFWRDWRTALLLERAQATANEAEQQLQSELAEGSGETQSALQSENDVQQGDLETFAVDGLRYQLLGVFNRVSGAQENDTFAALRNDGDPSSESPSDSSLSIREGDVLGNYRVQSVRSRSVVFESVIDDRMVTLWLFGTGPR